MEELRRGKEMQERCVEARKRRMEKMKNGNNDNGDDVNGSEKVEVYESGIIMPSSRRLIIGSQGINNSSSGGARQTARTRGPLGPQPLVQEPISQRPSTTDSRVEMVDMPLVSTQGEGPNGVKVQGFLYRYNIGEPVKIVCVCHGDFLTPAEFYKHGGGGDVDNPLKYISVTPFFIQ